MRFTRKLLSLLLSEGLGNSGDYDAGGIAFHVYNKSLL